MREREVREREMRERVRKQATLLWHSTILVLALTMTIIITEW